jgi:hypothetical protein
MSGRTARTCRAFVIGRGATDRIEAIREVFFTDFSVSRSSQGRQDEQSD